jgi:hypothetical protein
MTVIPTREKSIIETIQSIKNGTIVPDAMYCNIPKSYVRFEQQLDPSLISKLVEMGVTVIELDEDRACLNKILPILKYENDPDTLVATADDDLSYTPLWLEGLVKGHAQFGGVVGYSGMYYPENVIEATGTLRYAVTFGHGTKTHILENGFGTMFRLECIMGFPYIPPLKQGEDASMYLSDDYVLGRFYDFKNIIKTIVCWPEIGRQGDDWSSMCRVNDEGTHYSLFGDSTIEDENVSYQVIGYANNLKRYIKAGKIFAKILYHSDE